MTITRDSSLWKSNKGLINKLQGDVRVGIVRSEEYEPSTDLLFYQVEVLASNRRYYMTCRQMSRFGDVYNYEDWELRTNSFNGTIPSPGNWSTRVGEVVVVAPLDGQSVDGVILGALRHPARKLKTKADNLYYASEINGVETTVDQAGAYKVTFKGAPTNAALLKVLPPGAPIPPAIYNPATTGSYFTFTSDGSYEVSDNFLQSIKLDKPGQKITIKSGTVTIEIDKIKQKVTTSSLDWESTTLKSHKISTTQYEVTAKATAKIKAPKIAIGFGSIELIDQLIKLIDALSLIIVRSPVGPCDPMGSSPLWVKVNLIKAQLQVIKGSL
jgi:hypothetical protein